MFSLGRKTPAEKAAKEADRKVRSIANAIDIGLADKERAVPKMVYLQGEGHVDGIVAIATEHDQVIAERGLDMLEEMGGDEAVTGMIQIIQKHESLTRTALGQIIELVANNKASATNHHVQVLLREHTASALEIALIIADLRSARGDDLQGGELTALRDLALTLTHDITSEDSIQRAWQDGNYEVIRALAERAGRSELLRDEIDPENLADYFTQMAKGFEAAQADVAAAHAELFKAGDSTEPPPGPAAAAA